MLNFFEIKIKPLTVCYKTSVKNYFSEFFNSKTSGENVERDPLDVSSATTKDSQIKIIEDNPAASFIKVLGKSIYYKTSKLILLKQMERNTKK
jgi:hypothetical protein